MIDDGLSMADADRFRREPEYEVVDGKVRIVEGRGGPPRIKKVPVDLRKFVAAIEGNQAPTLPGSIKVGYRNYKVHPWPMSEAFAADREGECDNVNGVIRVEASRSRYDVAHTLIHELLHACFHVGCLRDDHDEEQTVSTVGSVLAQVLRDNPELRDYLAAVYA